MKRHRSLLLALGAAAAATAASSAPAMAQSSPGPCTASFHVLHDDRIGSLPVAAGMYQLTTNGISCAQASSRFAEFLKDYNGALPKPWRYNGENTFTAGTSGRSFTFARTDGPPAPGPIINGGGSHGDFECPGAFRVMHNDRIGRLSVPRGQYRVTVLGDNLSCDVAEGKFAQFLERPSGRLGGGWVVLPETGEFLHGSTYDGFRVKSIYHVR